MDTDKKEKKLFSVKGWSYEKKEVIDIKKNTKRTHRIRKLIILGKNLKWFEAKKLCKKYIGMRATIFPNTDNKVDFEIREEPKLEVIKL